VIWPDKTFGASSTDFSATLRKRAFENCCKNLSTIQRRDQKLWTFWPGTLVWMVVWPDETPSASSSDILSTVGKIPLQTPVKIWAWSNGRIKSYGPLEPVLWFGRLSGPTRRRRRLIGISLWRQGKQPPETPVKFKHNPTVGSRVRDILSQYSCLVIGMAREDLGCVK
jgi:hypothetical protein